MPETLRPDTDSEIGTDAVRAASPAHARTGFFSTAYSGAALLDAPISTGRLVHDSDSNGTKSEDPELPGLRINWEIKALVPITCVLLGGMLLFLLATLSWRDPERHIVLLVAGAGAVAICGALLVVLTYTVQRPMVELQQQIAQLGRGNLDVAVSFAHRNDEIGDLGRNFNQMVVSFAKAALRSNACTAPKCLVPSTSRLSEKWPPAWPTKSAIPWLELPASLKLLAAICL